NVALILDGGDKNHNDRLDRGETWVYHTGHTVTQQDMDNGVVENSVDGTEFDPDHGQFLLYSSVETLIVQEPSVRVERLVSNDGGNTWYFLPDLEGGAFDLASASGIPASQLVEGSPNTTPGEQVLIRLVVQNTGNVTLDDVVLNDSSGLISDEHTGWLGVGEF